MTCIAIKVVRREPGRDGKILCDLRQDGKCRMVMMRSIGYDVSQLFEHSTSMKYSAFLELNYCTFFESIAPTFSSVPYFRKYRSYPY